MIYAVIQSSFCVMLGCSTDVGVASVEATTHIQSSHGQVSHVGQEVEATKAKTSNQKQSPISSRQSLL